MAWSVLSYRAPSKEKRDALFNGMTDVNKEEAIEETNSSFTKRVSDIFADPSQLSKRFYFGAVVRFFQHTFVLLE